MIEEKRKKYNKQSKSQEVKQESSLYALNDNDQKKCSKEPIFDQLFFQTFETGIPLPGKHPISTAFDIDSTILKYFVVFVKNNKNHSNLNENPPEICFWQNENININENPNQFTALIKSQFSSLMNNETDYIYDLTNKNKNGILTEIKKSKKSNMIFHYIAPDIEQNLKNGFSIVNSEVDPLPLQELIENSGNSPTFIFDCDNSGYLLNIIKEKSYDGIFFFSCSEGESMPRSADYPVDLFTSCLTSPARVAVLWHSRHYFCFQSGSLQPIPTFFVEDMIGEKEKIDQLLFDLKLALKSTVESMAFENMEPQLFVKLFRTNSTLCDLCVHYFLACRILSYFNIHPISYPELPDLNECSQWQTFDLRLDATLYLLQSSPSIDDHFFNSLSYHTFLSQTLLSMKTFVFSPSTKKITVPFELSFFPDILNDPDLSDEACEVLAKYFDSSPDAVYYSLYYPIPQSLFRLLHKDIIQHSPKSLNSSLIFSIIKVICVYRDSIKNLIEFNWHKGIIDDLLPYMQNKNENSNLLAILLALLMRDLTLVSKKGVNISFKDHKSLCNIKIDNYDDETKRWILMLFSYAVPSIPDYFKIREILNQIVNFSKIAGPDLQIAIMCSLFGFTRSAISKNMNSNMMMVREENENIVLDTALQFSKSASYLLRRELLIFLKNFRKIHQEEFNKPIVDQEQKYQKVSIYFKQCENDPDDMVRQEVKKDESNSIIFDTYIASLLFPILPLISNLKQISFPDIFRSISDSNIKQEKQQQQGSGHHRNVTHGTRHRIEKYSKYAMKVTSLYKHQNKIVSNLLPIPKEKIVFADVSGNVCIKNWNDMTINSTIKVTNESITDVRYTDNYGSPLLFSATENGNCYVTSIKEKYTTNLSSNFKNSNSNLDNYSNSYFADGSSGGATGGTFDNDIQYENKTFYETSSRASFQLFPDAVFPCHMHQAIDEWNMRLYSYASHKSSEFKIRDLRADRFLPSIKPKKGSTKSLLLNPKAENIVALCGRGFEIYDLRTSHDEPQIYVIEQLLYPPFMVQFVDNSIPTFAISSKKSSVTKIDARHPEGAQTLELIYNMEIKHVMPSAFATCNTKVQIGKELTSVASLSHEFGISFFDVDNYAQELLPQNPKIGMKISNSSALAFHPEKYELSFVNNANFILNAAPETQNTLRF